MEKVLKYILKTVLCCFFIFLILIFVFQIIYKNKIIPNIYIANYNFSGLNRSQAKEKLLKLIKDFKEKQIFFSLNNEKKAIKIADLKIEFDIDKTLNNIFQYGHRKNIFKNLFDAFRGLTKNLKVHLVFKINKKEINKFLNKNFKKLNKKSKNAFLKYDSNIGDYAIYAESTGISIDEEKLLKDLKESINELKPKNIVIETKREAPQITINEAYQARNRALLIINQKIKIFYDNKFFKLDKNTISQFIDFKTKIINNQTKLIPVLNRDKIKDFLIQISPSIAREPQNAQLEYNPKTKTTEFIPELFGIKLDIEKSTEKLLKGISNNQKEIRLSLKEIKPKITVDYFKKLSITTLLGIGSSNFYGSPKNRIFNIKLGAQKFNGLIIPSGEEFSFNKIIGEITPESGYLPELVIKNNKTTPDYGGGLCQVSTTLFRAAVLSGLKITERYPHAFPVSYYNPQGFDAAIYPPSPDLKFINDTSNPILIQSKIKGYFLFFEIYGKPDGRKVKIIGPYEYDKKVDGSMKAKLTQEIYKNEKLIRRQTFYSNYKSPKLFPLEKNPLE